MNSSVYDFHCPCITRVDKEWQETVQPSQQRNSVLHRAGPPASGWQLSARTCNFVTSRPYWPATFCLVAMSTTMSIWTRVVTCHRLDGSIVFLVDAQNLPSTNLSGSLKGAIFPRPVVRPTPGYRFYIQSICVSMACNEQAMLSS